MTALTAVRPAGVTQSSRISLSWSSWSVSRTSMTCAGCAHAARVVARLLLERRRLLLRLGERAAVRRERGDDRRVGVVRRHRRLGSRRHGGEVGAHHLLARAEWVTAASGVAVVAQSLRAVLEHRARPRARKRSARIKIGHVGELGTRRVNYRRVNYRRDDEVVGAPPNSGCGFDSGCGFGCSEPQFQPGGCGCGCGEQRGDLRGGGDVAGCALFVSLLLHLLTTQRAFPGRLWLAVRRRARARLSRSIASAPFTRVDAVWCSRLLFSSADERK